MTIQFLPAFILGAITVIAVLCLIFRWFGLKKIRSFYVWVGALAVLGGAWAFLFPLAINADFSKNGDGAALRQMLIYTTGGVLGVITLGENHRKNSLEKFKNDQDHIRQVHSERRSRYTTAIEQLSNDKASTRLGGVYTLVGLVDEWLADEKTIPDIEERHKEGQVIINNLCAYIRSPLPLAERAEQLDKDYAKDLQNDFDGDIEKFDADKRAFARDKAALEEERQVRQSIIEEIHKRLQYIGTPDSWSKFDYDFSNAHFFYPIVFTNSYFDASSRFFGATFTQDTDFSGTAFTERAPFSEATFTCTPFSGTTFTERAPFSGAIFTKGVDFFRVTFTQDADFSETTFTEGALFSRATFLQDANFSRAAFTRDTHFFGAEFTEDANFNKATFTDYADFHGAKFSSYAKFFQAEFTGSTHFSEATFTDYTDFNGAKFTSANFSGATFTQNAYFSGAEFTSANFSGATFTQNAYFSGAKFTEYADFSKAEFTKYADFSGAKLFTGNTNFSQAEFIRANFSEAKFTSAGFSEAEFTWDADFSEAEFIRANFSEAKFTSADFSEAKFTWDADFSEAKFTSADFSEAEFTKYADFSGATFEEKPIFERALGDKTCKARFACKADPEDYNFEVSPDSPYKIETEEKEYNGVKFRIPKGAILFDPDGSSEQKDDNDS